MVGYEFLDHDAIGESYIGISVAEATDYTKSESDLVLISLPCYLFHQLCKSVGRSVRLWGVIRSTLCHQLSILLVSMSFYSCGALTCQVSWLWWLPLLAIVSFNCKTSTTLLYIILPPIQNIGPFRLHHRIKGVCAMPILPFSYFYNFLSFLPTTIISWITGSILDEMNEEQNRNNMRNRSVWS